LTSRVGIYALSQINPRLVYTSLTAFGQSGPYSDYKASDIVVMAMSGHMYLTGDATAVPAHRFSPGFSPWAAEAAVGTMVAHYYRETTGEGQFVDTSAQASVGWALITGFMFWDLLKIKAMRSGIYRGWAGPSAAKQTVLWPSKDGYIAFAIYGGLIGATTNKGVVAWLEEEGLCNDFLRGVDWNTFDVAHITQQEFDQFASAFSELCRRHTTRELMDRAKSGE